MTLREKFVARFDEETAKAIEEASLSHQTDTDWSSAGTQKPGSDAFKTHLRVCVGYECMSREMFRQHHGIKPPWEKIKQWIIDEADLLNHDGGGDPLMEVNHHFDFLRTKPTNN